MKQASPELVEAIKDILAVAYVWHQLDIDPRLAYIPSEAKNKLSTQFEAKRKHIKDTWDFNIPEYTDLYTQDGN